MNNIMIVTGTRKGIGRYLAEAYLNEGYTVYGCSRRECDINHSHYHHAHLDVGDEQNVVDYVKHVYLREKRLDILVNNAGIGLMNHSVLTSTESAMRMMMTNYGGTFSFSRECAKYMIKQQEGRIVNFSSIAVPSHLEGELAYSASKSAIEQLTKVMAREVGPFNVTVNAVGPSPVNTNLISRVQPEKIERLIDDQSCKVMASYEDVKNVIDFYISPQSKLITGQVVYLGGFC